MWEIKHYDWCPECGRRAITPGDFLCVPCRVDLENEMEWVLNG